MLATTAHSDRSGLQSARCSIGFDTVCFVEFTYPCLTCAPEATLSFDADADVTALLDSTTSLETAVENLLENAFEHHDRPDPDVSVTVDSTPSTAVITTADDGPGIPPVERAVLSADSETPLEHGSGLGLWLVHWLVTGCGGSLSFEENEPRGSIVTIRLPRPADGN